MFAFPIVSKDRLCEYYQTEDPLEYANEFMKGLDQLHTFRMEWQEFQSPEELLALLQTTVSLLNNTLLLLCCIVCYSDIIIL